jgi:hypothetical protein
VSPLPSWIEAVAQASHTQNMANYTPRLIQALGIALKELENHSTAHWGCCTNAIIRIEDLGKP